jgi:amino acid adenylation domain-containing protein
MSDPETEQAYSLSAQQRALADNVAPYRVQLSICGEDDAGRVRQAVERVATEQVLLQCGTQKLAGRTELVLVRRSAPRVAWCERGFAGPFAEACDWRAALHQGHGGLDLTLELPAHLADIPSFRTLAEQLEHGLSSEQHEHDGANYLEYSAWQATLSTHASAQQGRAYWDSAPALDRRDATLPDVFAASGGLREMLAPALSDALVRVAHAHGVELETLLLAGWAALLARLHDEPLRVDYLDSGRVEPDLARMVGPLERPLPLATPEPTARFSDYLFDLQRELMEARAFREFAPLVASSERCAFRFWDVAKAHATGGARVSVSSLEGGPAATVLHTDGQRLVLTAPGRSARSRAGVLELYTELLASVAVTPMAPIARLSIMPTQQREWLEARSRGASPKHAVPTFLELFWRQVREQPDAVAVRCGERSFTYLELGALVESVVAGLRELGVGAGDRVAALMPRGLELAPIVLGILEAQAVFVPLDPEYPRYHLDYLIEDSQPKLVVVAGADDSGERPPRVSARRLLTVSASASRRADSEPEALAYLMYTSGSSGRPKGVMVHHRGLANYLDFARTTYPVQEGNGAPLHTSVSFDLSVTSLLLPLTAGKCVTFVSDENGVTGLLRELEKDTVFSLVKITPSHLSLLKQLGSISAVCKRTESLVVGGEQLTRDLLESILSCERAPRVFNEYGPTETVVGCSVHEASLDNDHSAVPIGLPILRTELYVLDGRLNQVPLGATGELYIGGAGVAHGYWNRPKLTAERFIPSPFSETDGARLYRTGDLVRWLPEGTLLFLGRRDSQVKLHGHRIETDEIRARLLDHPRVLDAAVLVGKVAGDNPALLAYVVPRAGTMPNPNELRAHLAQRLPAFMVPSAFLALASIPVTSNGKLDRAALPAADRATRRSIRPMVAASTAAERAIAEVWISILGLETVSVEDSFFEVGGNSFQLIRSVVRINEVLGAQLTPLDVFTHPTIAGIARLLSGESQHLPGEEDRESRAQLRRSLAAARLASRRGNPR